jgi:predicted transposase YdaD
MVAQRNPQIRKAVVKLRELSADERARDMFERREKGRRDAADREKGALKKQAIEIALVMLTDGETVEKIIKYTGLTREEIEALRDTM